MLLAEKLDDQQHYPQLNFVAARALQEKASTASSKGNIDAAETLLADALRNNPSLMSIYDQLGRLYKEKSETEARTAERCFKGFLPESFINAHFKQSYISSPVSEISSDLRSSMREMNADISHKRTVVCESDGFTRHHCAVETTRSIPKPIGITSTSDQMFSPTALKSSVALVDQVPNGKLWFDGFNRMVLDKSDRIIEQHTRGSAELLHSICDESEPYKIPGRCFLIGNRGFDNFCHWMVDILPSIGLFQQSGLSFKHSDRFLVQNASSKFQRACLHHFGIKDEQIVEVTQSSPYIQAEELIVPYFSNAMSMTMGSWIPRFLKSSFLSFSAQSPINAKKIYLARSNDARNGRGIPNEPELIEHLERRGFVAIRPELYSVSQQAEIFAQADVIVAGHGAAFTSIVFCRPGTSIIELYGDYMATSFWATSAICGLHYLNHYCGAEAEYTDSQSHEFIQDLRKKGFSVNVNELDRLLDLEEDTNPRP